MQYKLIAKCLFGLEKTLSYEVTKCGGVNVTVSDGAVIFEGDEAVIARANLSCRVAERIGILLGRFSAVTFDDIFDYVKTVDLRGIIEKGGAFPVKAGHTLDSALTSIPAIQRTVKKALAENLAAHGNTAAVVTDTDGVAARARSEVDESGAIYPVIFNIRKNIMELCIDTSGDSLHKRGYRAAPNTVTAPLRETLAAGIIDVCRVRAGDTVTDPFCGSGTILIEAALKARRIPPCLNRDFISVRWRGFSRVYKAAREELRAGIIPAADAVIPRGYDIDPGAVEVTRRNAAAAGVAVSADVCDVRDFGVNSGGAGKNIIVTNPPYGERLSTPAEVAEIYGVMGRRFADYDSGGISVNVLSPHEDFCALYNAHCSPDLQFRNRKFYNGALQVRLYSGNCR